MRGLTKLASLFSGTIFSFVTIMVSCGVVAVAFLWQQQLITSQVQQQQQNQQTQAVNMLKKVTTAEITVLKKQMVSVAQRAELAIILAESDTVQIDYQQQVLKQVFPLAKNICLISAEVDNVDNTACIPITFASLESLREAKKDGSSAMAVMKVGTEEAYLLLAQRIIDQNNHIVGVLALTFSPDVVKTLFSHEGLGGYAELLQGSANAAILAVQGDAKFKQGAARFQIDLAGTHWRIAYWPETLFTTTSPLMIILAVLGVMLLMWLLRESIRSYVYKYDVATIRQQLLDFKTSTLKTKYDVSNQALRAISEQIQSMGKTLTAANSSNNATTDVETTSERISKKLEADKTDNPAELDLLDDQVDVDPAIFKAYDIRGIVDESLNPQVIRLIGRAIGSEAQEQGITQLIVGFDGRHSSPEFSDALIKGILATGCNVTDIGMVPTPVLYFASHHLNTQSAVMITGSHNPANYNGVKLVLAGKSFSGDDIQGLYRRIEQGNFLRGQGSRQEADVTADYIQRIADDIQLPRPIKVVIDCGNGVAGGVAPLLFRALGCEVIDLYCEVDGDFPNHHPDPSQPDNLQDLVNAVQDHEAELGIAFDGDGDRLGVVDATGNAIFADRLMMMFAHDVLLRMPGSVIIYDVKSSNLLGEEIFRAGGEAIMWKSGHSVIKNKMLEMDAQLAGELSGHIFFKERWYGFDDGMYAAARLLELLCQDPLERTPTEIFSALPNRQNTPEILLEMDEKESKLFMAQLQKEGDFPNAQINTIDGLRADYANGWGLVRASNTVPGLTLRFEADTPDDLFQIQERFKRQMLQIKPTLIVSFTGSALSSLALTEEEPLSLD